MVFNYEEVCEDLLEGLPSRAQEIINRRFGLSGQEKETLQAIALDCGITRERVRQIENAGLKKAQERVQRHEPVFSFFSNQLKTFGNLRKESTLLKILSPDPFENQAFFLLWLNPGFNRFLENEALHTSWTIDKKTFAFAQKTNGQLAQKVNKVNRPLKMSELASMMKMEPTILFAFLEASKLINQGPEGSWGLSQWSEINPRGIRDKAYIVLKKEKKPLHFTEVARLIDGVELFSASKKAHPQTVHNELIRDSRFVLVGRGLYALADWGYQPGTVREVISQVLKQAKKGLTQEEVMDRVLAKRMVKRNTILLNLKNKKLFRKDKQEKYHLA